MGIVATAQVDAEERRRFYELGWWRERTVVEDFQEAAARHPQKVAVVAVHGDGTDRPSEVITYGRLAALVDRAAAGLVGLGVQPGDPVSFQLPNWWELAVLTLACGRIGAVANPILPILRRREVGHILARIGSRVCVVPTTFRGFDHGAMLSELVDELPQLQHPVVVGGPLAGTDTFEEAILGGGLGPDDDAGPLPDAVVRFRPDPDAVAQAQFTSGTTGEPKGVLHTHNTLWAGVRAVLDPLALGPDDVVLMASTMAHQTGYLYGCLMPLAAGMKVVYQDTWDGGQMVRLVAEEGVTWTMGATPFVLDAIAAQRAEPRQLTTLRYFACAGAPIPPHIVAAAAEVLGTRLMSIWGMTENGAVTIVHPSDPPEAAATTDGRPVPWMAVRVVDEGDRDVPPGVVGRLLVRGASQCVGYLDRPDLYRAQVRDGWFDTGDLARLDTSGAVRIAGRAKDLVIRGGENVPVVEVEALLYRHPKVREVAVVGVPDERLGERACAVVVADGDAPDLQELTDHLQAAGMARQYWPERLVVVDELPKTASGKIQKYRLREQLAGA